MSTTELRTFRIRCDRCSTAIIVHDTGLRLPDGWTRVQTHGWGATNYSRDEEYCPKCSETVPSPSGEKK